MWRNKINRICIIGGSGTGKTTLSDNLSKILNIPVYHIDGIHYLENWKIRNKAERDSIILQIINDEKWIMDGTYTSTLKQRLSRADCIIYLDYSTISQIYGLLKRFLKNNGKEKADIPGCKERISFNFFWWVLKWRKNKRQLIFEYLKEFESNKIHVFKNRHQLKKWYKNTFEKNYKI